MFHIHIHTTHRDLLAQQWRLRNPLKLEQIRAEIFWHCYRSCYNHTFEHINYGITLRKPLNHFLSHKCTIVTFKDAAMSWSILWTRPTIHYFFNFQSIKVSHRENLKMESWCATRWRWISFNQKSSQFIDPLTKHTNWNCTEDYGQQNWKHTDYLAEIWSSSE